MTKLLCISIVSMLLAGTLAIAHNPRTKTRPDQDPTRRSELARIFASGIVEGRTEEIELRPEVTGRVKRVLVQVGDWVEANQILFELEDQAARAQAAAGLARLNLARAKLERLINGARDTEREEARAMLNAARARLHQAELTWTRVQSLRAQNATTEQEADEREGVVLTLSAEVSAAEARLAQLEAPAREDEVRAAQANVAVAEAEYDLAKEEQSRLSLRAPAPGRILDLNVEVGELVAPTDAHASVVVADTSQIRVRAFVEELDAPRIQEGARAVVTADGMPNECFDAQVASVSPRMNLKRISAGHSDELYDTKVLEAVLTMTERPNLLIGLRVDVEIFLAEGR